MSVGPLDWVDFDWIEIDASPTTAAMPRTSRRHVTDNSCTTKLQALVDAAATGATLDVPPCTYREMVRITKPLTLDGHGQAEIRGSDVWSDWTQVAPTGCMVRCRACQPIPIHRTVRLAPTTVACTPSRSLSTALR